MIPQSSMLVPPAVQHPDRATPLAFRVTPEEFLRVRRLLGRCPYDAVLPSIAALDRQLAAQLDGKRLTDVSPERVLTFECSYGAYLSVLGLLGALPYAEVGAVVHELARQVEGQLQSAGQLQAVETAKGTMQ